MHTFYSGSVSRSATEIGLKLLQHHSYKYTHTHTVQRLFVSISADALIALESYNSSWMPVHYDSQLASNSAPHYFFFFFFFSGLFLVFVQFRFFATFLFFTHRSCSFCKSILPNFNRSTDSTKSNRNFRSRLRTLPSVHIIPLGWRWRSSSNQNLTQHS